MPPFDGEIACLNAERTNAECGLQHRISRRFQSERGERRYYSHDYGSRRTGLEHDAPAEETLFVFTGAWCRIAYNPQNSGESLYQVGEDERSPVLLCCRLMLSPTSCPH